MTILSPFDPMRRTVLAFASLLLAAPLVSQLVAQLPAPKPGRYGCSESLPRFRGGGWEYEIETRGFVTLERGGRYVDPFKVAGRWTTTGDTTRFTGGALDGAKATPMKNDRLFIVIPTAKKDRRWACGRN